MEAQLLCRLASSLVIVLKPTEQQTQGHIPGHSAVAWKPYKCNRDWAYANGFPVLAEYLDVGRIGTAKNGSMVWGGES